MFWYKTVFSSTFPENFSLQSAIQLYAGNMNVFAGIVKHKILFSAMLQITYLSKLVGMHLI